MFTRLCKLLVAALRHRSGALKRCMALTAALCRRLVHILGPLCKEAADDGASCAAQLSNVYASLAETEVRVRTRCEAQALKAS